MTRKGLFRATAAALVLAALFVLVSCGFSYEKSNLNKYVDIPRGEYYGISVSVAAPKEVEEKDIDLEIETFRLNLRELVSEGEKATHASWGDNVNLYYHITVEGGIGSFLPESGYSDLTESKPGQFVIGGGVLPSAFENGLTGHAAIETDFSPSFSETDTVAETDVVYLDLAYRLTDGGETVEGSTEGVRIALAENEAARAVFVGLHPGDAFDCGYESGEPIVFDWDGDGDTETLAAKGTLRCRSRSEILGRIEGVVPDDYFDPTLAGKRCVLLYAIDSVDVYSVPEITEELLAENVPDFTLSEGGDLEEEFRDYVYRLLANESRREWQAAVETELWKHFDTLDCIKQYPSRALRDEMDEQRRQLDRLYEYYGAKLEEEYGVNPYETAEDFGYAYYELEGSNYSDVYDYLKKEVVPLTVKQKLIIYYIAGREGWKITEAEYEAELPRQVSYYASADGITVAEAMEKYGETFFRQAIQYNRVLTELVDVAVTE